MTDEKEKKAAKEAYKQLIGSFSKQFMEEVTRTGNDYFYQPKKPKTDAEAIVTTISTTIESSPISTRFKDIINRNLRGAIHDYLLGKKISQI